MRSCLLLLIAAIPFALCGLSIPLNNEHSQPSLSNERTLQSKLALDLPGTQGERMRRIPEVITPLHYYVRIRPYFPNPYTDLPQGRNMTFDGTQTFIFQVKKATPTITIHSLDLTYSSMKIFDDNGTLIEENPQHSFNETLHHLIITPRTALTVGRNYMMQFQYEGNINDYLTAGLYYTSFTDIDGTVHWIVVTHMEPARARFVFPCLDEPAYKAIFHITLIYPNGLVALANTMERTPVPAKAYGNGWNAMRFPPTLQMSTYLVAFAVGPFVSQQTYDEAGTLVRIWGWTGQEKYLEFAAEVSAKCLYKMGVYTNFKYPMFKSDQLGLPQFVAGAMENYGLIIYKYQFIAYDPNVQSTFYKQAAARVMCHELSHQWFGDTVTALWWDDLFLQEGFAAYFENYGLRMALPEQIPFLEGKFLAESRQRGFQADASLSYPSHPIFDANGPFFDFITYLKGASMLRMIRSLIGPDAFQTALQEYIAKYKFSSANHTMLFDLFTSVSTGVKDWCGRPFDANAFFDPWFVQQGFPEVMVVNNQLMGASVITQQPFNAYETLPPSPVYNYSWPIPLFYRFYMDFYKTQIASFQWLSPAYENCGATNMKSSVQNRAVHWDFDNANASAFVRVEYDDIGYDRLMQRLRAKPGEFSLADKATLISDRFAFLQRQIERGEPFSFKRLIDVLTAVLPNSPNYGVMGLSQDIIDMLELLFLDGPDYGLFQRFIRKVLTDNYKQLQWDVTGDWDRDVTRYLILPYAVRYDVDDAVAKGNTHFGEFLKQCEGTTNGVDTCNKVHPDLRIAAYCAGIKTGTTADFDRLMELMDQQYKNNFYFYQEYYAMFEGMSCTTRQSDMNRLIKRILNIVRFPQDKYKLARLPYDIIIKNPMAGEWMGKYLLNNANDAKEVLDSPNFEEYLRSMTSVWYTKARLALMQTIRDKLSPQATPGQKELLEKYYNITAQHVDWRSKHYPDLSRVFYNEYVIGPFDMENWNTRLPTGLKPLSYDIKIKPHIPGSAKYPWYKNMTFEGSVEMNFTAIQPVSDYITLNSHRMVVEASDITLQRADGLGQVYTFETIEKDFEFAFLKIPLPSGLTLTPGVTWTLSIKYTGFIFGNPSKGVYTNTNFFEFNGKMAWIFSTYFESGPSARSLVPCFDQPNYKATWQLSIQHPADMIALSNMPDTGFTVHEEGWAVTSFQRTPLMSSYLLAVAAGHFASLQTVSQTEVLVRAWAWTGMERYAEKALMTAAGTVDFLATHFDFPYMLPKLDVLALPQYTTMRGAEEHWGFIHILYNYMLADPAYATSSDYAEIASITAHETVHQWFGNLVTLEFWPNIFLNEAFANYWETNGANHTFPEQAANSKLERFFKAYSGFNIDSSASTSKPLVPDKPKYFSGIPYNKGATLLHMLNQALGAPVFQAGLRSYLRKYQYGNAAAADLYASLTEAARANNVIGWNNQLLDVGELMGAWTYQATYPVLKVVTQGQQVTYSQEPYILDTSSLQPTNYSYLWNIPVHTQTPKGMQFHYFTGKDGTDSFWRRTFDGQWQIDNAELGGFFRVWYDDTTWAPIQKQLETDPFVFDVLTRAQLVSDTVSLHQRGSLKWDRVMQIGLYLVKETEYAPYYAFRSVINNFITMLTATDTSNANDMETWNVVKKYITKIIGPLYDRVGWANTSDWTQNMLATWVTEYACRLDYSHCRSQASLKFLDFYTDCALTESPSGVCNSVVPDLRRSQYCWGVHRNPGKIDLVKTMYQWFIDNSKYFNRDTENMLEAQACITDQTVLNGLVNDALVGKLPTTMIAHLGDRDETKRLLWNYFIANQDAVSFGVPDFADYMSAAMVKWNSVDDLKLATDFLSSANGMKLSSDEQNAIRNAMNTVQSRLNWRAQNEASIVSWLKNNVAKLYD
ncbi:Thyrotropin-releasing hormone-degrading ectoenzyme [Toxocara canis]|uniref:Thyrotropin-releasing hormone-degrading ectoenzyme n=1 Tax=Toxocara canis TaxID=6265 RepID=A0A0B2V4Y5_TOXCA|nr:Thyrotropin-releasing hormone-degrading ectoenzyme [Toxocara canis]